MGTAVSVERLEGDLGSDVDLLEIPSSPKTIDACPPLERELTGDDFAADFDDEAGHPTHVLVDRIADAVDDESFEFYIPDFTVTSTPVGLGLVDVAVTTGSMGRATAAPTASDVEAQLRGLVDDAVNASASIPGFIVHVEAPGRGLDVSVAAGVADRATGAPLEVDAGVRIASNTKTFTAAAILRLVEQARLELDARSLSLSLPTRSRCWTRVAIGPT